MEPPKEPESDSPAEATQTGSFGPRPFGRYYLLDRIAVGGMAEVFLAKTFGHAGFEKVLVVKRILESFADDPSFVEMFVDEAKLSAQLVHPNVVQLHDFGKQGGHWFLAMEAVHGKDMKSVMRRLAERGERIPVELAAVVFHEVARGLHYAHTLKDPTGAPLNIVHRDVSPSNVLLSYGGRVKLVDFGIAKAETTRDESAEAHLLKGKFQYMSPEQTERKSLDHRSDVFAAGICLWEMLTGHRLFKRDEDFEVIEAIRAGNVTPPSHYNPSVPPALDAICLRALETRLEDRYPDARAMQRELQDFLLPSTPERLQNSMQQFLAKIFAQEIVDARAQLEDATRVAADIHYGSDDLELEEEEEPGPFEGAQTVPLPQGHSTGTLSPPSAQKTSSKRLVVAALILLGFVAAATWFTNLPPPIPTVASLSVTVQPEDVEGLTMTLDGQPFTSPSDTITPDIAHELVISADGFESRTKSLELTPGQVFSIEIALTKTAVEPPPAPVAPDITPAPKPKPVEVKTEPTPPAAAQGPPVLAFRSTPKGAKVYVDGRPIGVTPLNWESGSPTVEYNVEFRMSGYSSVQAVVAAPAKGERRRLSRTLEVKEVVEEKKVPGKLSVQVSSGWARIYVDGAYVDTTPLFEHSIAAGTYTIRVVNERTGLDLNQQVVVRAGEVARKTFRVAE